MNDNYNELGYVLSSHYRFKVLNCLMKENKQPTQISKELSQSKTQTSTTLSELKKAELVECIDESKRKGREYKLTKKGKKVINFTIKNKLMKL